MPKPQLIAFLSILILGFLDWLTTITGVVYFGATELNPLFAGLTQANLIFFSAVKLVAITLASLAFYKAVGITSQKGSDWKFTNTFLASGFSMTFLFLVAIVGNNLITLFA